MSTAAKLKKRAIELEQKKQFDRALALYVQFLQESDGSLDDADIPLYNRVGDLLIRTGNTSDALNHFEKAIDLYAERGFLNNAIALCNRVLRQAPGRACTLHFRPRVGRVPSEVAHPALALGLVERLHRRRLSELPIANSHDCLKRSASTDRSPCGATAARLAARISS